MHIFGYRCISNLRMAVVTNGHTGMATDCRYTPLGGYYVSVRAFFKRPDTAVFRRDCLCQFLHDRRFAGTKSAALVEGAESGEG